MATPEQKTQAVDAKLLQALLSFAGRLAKASDPEVQSAAQQFQNEVKRVKSQT